MKRAFKKNAAAGRGLGTDLLAGKLPGAGDALGRQDTAGISGRDGERRECGYRGNAAELGAH